MRLPPQRIHANSNLLHGGSVEVDATTAAKLQQQHQQQQQQPNCDINPFVISTPNINSYRQTVSQDSLLGSQCRNNSTSAQSLNIPTSGPSLNIPTSLAIPNSDPLVRAQAGHGGRVLFTKNASGLAQPNVPSVGRIIPSGGPNIPSVGLYVANGALTQRQNIHSGSVQQGPGGGLNIPSEIEADILGLHRRLEPDFDVCVEFFIHNFQGNLSLNRTVKIYYLGSERHRPNKTGTSWVSTTR
jgi:hypothetical protein